MVLGTLFLWAICTSLFVPQACRETNSQNRVALCIGLETVSEPASRALGLTPLQGSREAAEYMKTSLDASGWRTTLLTTAADTTRSSIINAIEKIADESRKSPPHSVLLFLSGHGILEWFGYTAQEFKSDMYESRLLFATSDLVVESPTGNEKPPDPRIIESYWKSFLKQPSTFRIVTQGKLTFRELLSSLGKIQCNNLILLIDACNSGMTNADRERVLQWDKSRSSGVLTRLSIAFSSVAGEETWVPADAHIANVTVQSLNYTPSVKGTIRFVGPVEVWWETEDALPRFRDLMQGAPFSTFSFSAIYAMSPRFDSDADGNVDENEYLTALFDTVQLCDQMLLHAYDSTTLTNGEKSESNRPRTSHPGFLAVGPPRFTVIAAGRPEKRPSLANHSTLMPNPSDHRTDVLELLIKIDEAVQELARAEDREDESDDPSASSIEPIIIPGDITSKAAKSIATEFMREGPSSARFRTGVEFARVAAGLGEADARLLYIASLFTENQPSKSLMGPHLLEVSRAKENLGLVGQFLILAHAGDVLPLGVGERERLGEKLAAVAKKYRSSARSGKKRLELSSLSLPNPIDLLIDTLLIDVMEMIATNRNQAAFYFGEELLTSFKGNDDPLLDRDPRNSTWPQRLFEMRMYAEHELDARGFGWAHESLRSALLSNAQGANP